MGKSRHRQSLTANLRETPLDRPVAFAVYAKSAHRNFLRWATVNFARISCAAQLFHQLAQCHADKVLCHGRNDSRPRQSAILADPYGN